MDTMQTLSGLVSQTLSRTKEATLGVLDIGDAHLRTFLREQMSGELGDKHCFLADPVIEHTFGWETGELTFDDLSKDKGHYRFSQALIDLLADKKTPESYRFEGYFKPYKHQLLAWETLTAPTPQSAIVTSGTGSGKTECFMLPIIDRLIRKQQQTGQPLIGVNALFLYPLNALINSQQERLDAWTHAFGDDIRFCLYNGNTKETEQEVKKDQTEHPNQIFSRQRLRREPSPLLMTNATMLEYMLVRQADLPILQISRENQSLEWIVLDEAHTYIGSQAAEISLLLRRVIHAFGKKPEDIRFVATSATIAGDDGQEQLQQYLADLAGISPEQVTVISGKRLFEDIPVGNSQQTLAEMQAIDEEQLDSRLRYQALANHRLASTVRDTLVNHTKPMTLNQVIARCESLLASTTRAEQQRELLAWLDLMTQTRNPDGELFLKLRLHLFQQMLHGVWVCADKDCTHKSASLGDWQFGQVYLHQREFCDCGTPVYELALCQECGEPHLLAEDSNGILNSVTIVLPMNFLCC